MYAAIWHNFTLTKLAGYMPSIRFNTVTRMQCVLRMVYD